MAYSIHSEVYSHVNKYDISRPYLFDVKFTFPINEKYFDKFLTYGRDLTLSCFNAELPGRTFATTEQKYYGPTQKFPLMTSYNDITLEFICRDVDFLEKKLFDIWFDIINPPNFNPDNSFSYNFIYKQEYTANIIITQYSLSGAKLYSVELKDAFPIAMDPLELNWGDGDGLHKLSVTFAYTSWSPYDIYKNDPNISSVDQSGIELANSYEYPTEQFNPELETAINISQQQQITSSALSTILSAVDTGYNLTNASKNSWETGLGIAASVLPGMGMSNFNISNITSFIEGTGNKYNAIETSSLKSLSDAATAATAATTPTGSAISKFPNVK